MGFLTDGTPLDWKDSKNYRKYGEKHEHLAWKWLKEPKFRFKMEGNCYFTNLTSTFYIYFYVIVVKQRGLVQFVHVFNRVRERSNDQLLWGDEVSITQPFSKNHMKLYSFTFLFLFLFFLPTKILPYTWILRSFPPKLLDSQVEYHIVRFNHENQYVQISLRSSEVLHHLTEQDEKNAEEGYVYVWIRI